MANKPKMSARAKKLLKMIPFSYNKVLEIYEGRDFCEYVLYRAGDVMTYRVYDNGEVYAR